MDKGLFMDYLSRTKSIENNSDYSQVIIEISENLESMITRGVFDLDILDEELVSYMNKIIFNKGTNKIERGCLSELKRQIQIGAFDSKEDRENFKHIVNSMKSIGLGDDEINLLLDYRIMKKNKEI